MTPTDLTGVVAAHIAAVNVRDIDAIMATFNYFGVRDGKIVSLIVVFNQPAY